MKCGTRWAAYAVSDADLRRELQPLRMLHQRQNLPATRHLVDLLPFVVQAFPLLGSSSCERISSHSDNLLSRFAQFFCSFFFSAPRPFTPLCSDTQPHPFLCTFLLLFELLRLLNTFVINSKYEKRQNRFHGLLHSFSLLAILNSGKTAR